MNFLFFNFKIRFLFSQIPLALLVSVCFISAAAVAGERAFPAVFAFGDSILDTGNNNKLKTLSKCNFHPYGRNFPRRKATGRFGNGRVLSDIVAKGLGIKDLLPPHRRGVDGKDLKTGVSFASGGSGLDPLTARLQGVIWVPDQVKDFKKYLKKLRGRVGDEKRVKKLISKAVFLISAGNSDLAITYYSTASRKTRFSISSYSNKLVTWTNSFLKKLYDLGARKFAVLGTLPLGCLPGTRTRKGGPMRMCSRNMNKGCLTFNKKLAKELKKLPRKRRFRGAKFVYVDMYNSLLDLIDHPLRHGFFFTADGCCCMITRPRQCLVVSMYVFWDYGHPSERAYKIIAPRIVHQIKKRLA